MAENENEGVSPVAENVFRLRKALGWSQDELGEAAGVTGQTIWNIESGRTRPREESLGGIAKALGVTVRYLYTPHPGGPTALPQPLRQALEENLLKPPPTPEEIAELAAFKFRGKPTPQTFVFLLHALRQNE